MIDGQAEERIGDTRERAKAGDVIRLGSSFITSRISETSHVCIMQFSGINMHFFW
jgi:hypothetical protein